MFCPSFLLCFPVLYQQSLPHIFHRSNVGSLFDCPPSPLSFQTSFLPHCCIVQNGFLLQETSSRKSQSASLPPREMFSAIHNNSSTPPRKSTLANFTGLFNRRCLVNSLPNSGKYFFSLTSLGCSVANEVTRKRARSETKILYTEFGYVKI